MSVEATTRSLRQARTIGGADLGQDRSREAKRLAAAVLEVLAGARTPTEAATALGLSLPRYYQVESRALAGLLSACEPKPKGRAANPATEAARLRQENLRLQHEVTRQQSLARTVQRTVGWMPPPAPAKTTNNKKPRKRRTARALSIAARLQSADPVQPAAVPPLQPLGV
jgi:hypothetical protein